MTATNRSGLLSPRGNLAATVEAVAAYSLLTMLAAGCALLWWPSVNGWLALCSALPAIWACWLLGKTISGDSSVPGNLLHAGLLGLLAMASYHGLHDGLAQTTGWPTPLLGQISGSLALQILFIALLVTLCDDLLNSRKLMAGLIISAAAILGSAGGLLVSTRPEGSMMLVFITLSAVASIAALLGPALVKNFAINNNNAIYHKLLRFSGWLTLPACLVAMVMAIGINTMPDTRYISLLGLGDQALAVTPDWSSSWLLLACSLGWPAAALPLVLLFAGAIVLLKRASLKPNPAYMVSAGFGVLSAGFAMAAWMSPGGAFCPAVNLLMPLSWSLHLGHAMKAPTRRSGWYMMAAVIWCCMLLALIRRMGLLLWIIEDFSHRDIILHGFFGWAITQALLLMLNRRKWGVVAAAGLSLGASALGELAQKLWSMRTYELADFLSHAAGAGVALLLYLLCRAASHGQKKPAKRSQT